MRRRATASIIASPLLIGAVTVLVLGIAVFLGYNANQGLPFVPAYELEAEVPTAANLVVGNDVRLGGFRVGQVAEITPRTIERDGRTRSIAVLGLLLDKSAEPLPADTAVIVRTRSALGLKYVQISPGSSDEALLPGDTIPLANAGRPVEFDDFLDTFDERTRDDQRRLIAGFGDALAGRGDDLNVTIGELPRLFGSLTTVMDALNDPSTGLDQLFRQIGAAAAQVEPVASTQAALFTNLADTFEAISRDPQALRDTIVESSATLAQGERSLALQRPFLDNLAGLSARLRPAVRALPAALPDLNSALAEGRRVLPRTVGTSRRLEATLVALRELGDDPNTLGATRDLRYALATLKPFIRYVAPVNTVCNFGNYFFPRLGEHISQQVDGGTSERIELSFDNFVQPNRLGATENARPADVPEGESVYGQTYPTGPATRPNQLFYDAGVFGAVLTEDGKANCQEANRGYPVGPIIEHGRYVPDDGGRHVVFNDGMPFVSGPTFTGVPSLRKVDSGAEFSLRQAP